MPNPPVLDGDDGLGSEVLHQRNLLVGERTYFLPVNSDRTDQHMKMSTVSSSFPR
jgi:hypothetical protein